MFLLIMLELDCRCCFLMLCLMSGIVCLILILLVFLCVCSGWCVLWLLWVVVGGLFLL